MNLKIAQVIGLNTDQKAAQVISIFRDGDNTFFAVLDLTCDDAFTKGRLSLSELSDFYFDFESGSAGEKLNATFEEAKKKFANEEFSLLLATVSGKILYLKGIGSIEVYLKRAQKLSSLLSVGPEAQLVSGFLQAGDRLLFSTKSLINFLGDDLTKSLQLPLDVFEQEITDRIGASNLENEGLAALAVEVAQEDLAEQGIEESNIPSLKEDTFENPLISTTDSPNRNSMSVLKKALTGFLNFFWQIKSYFPKSGRGKLALAVLLIVIIALGLGFKVKASKDAQKQAIFAQALQGAKDDFNAAKGLSTLNPADAKSKLDSAKNKLSKALSLKSNDQEAQNLKKQIDQDSSLILMQESVSEFPLFLDMELIKKNFRAVSLGLSDGKLLLLDPAVKTLVVVDLAKKSNQILAGSEQLGEANFASLNGGLAFVYSKDKGVLRVDITNQKVTVVSKKDSDWGEIKDIYGFAGNVYLLDSGKNMIWKYLPTDNGYSDKREYLSKNTKADLSNALRMQIESSVYVLKSGGEILRFTKGEKDNFGLEGLDKAVKEPKSIFISSDTDNLYVLDSGNSRVLILTKTGKYKGQITGGKFAQASDLVVDEKGKKIYLLDGSKIFQVDLK